MDNIWLSVDPVFIKNEINFEQVYNLSTLIKNDCTYPAIENIITSFENAN